MKPQFTEIPEHLVNLQEPTRSQITDLAERRLRASGIPDRFEDSKEYARTNFMPALREEHRSTWVKRRQEAIDSAAITLEDTYQRDLAQLKAIQENNARVLDARTAEMKAGYLAAGGTETEFAAALPALLEEQRRQAAMSAASDRDAQVQQALRSGTYA